MKPNKTRCLYCNKDLPGFVPCGCPLSIEQLSKYLWDAHKRRYEKNRPKEARRYNE